MYGRAAVFLDVQGTLGGEGLGDIRDFTFYPPAIPAVKMLNEANLRAIVVTNQSRIAQGLFTYECFLERMESLKQELREGGARLDAVYCCPHYGFTHTVGFAVIHHIRKPNIDFLVYLAVSRPMRGQGVGSLLISMMKNPIVTEVDDPDTAETSDEREVRLRRICFFEKHGFRQFKKGYWQPQASLGKNPVQMILMLKGFIPYASEDVVKAIYYQKYEAMNSIPSDQLQKLLGITFPKNTA